jgi:hypothetical protein
MCFAGMTLMHVNNRRGELERRSFLHCYLPNGFYIHQSQSIKCIAPPPPLYLTLAVIIATRESTVCVFAQPCDFWCVRRRQFFSIKYLNGLAYILRSVTREVYFFVWFKEKISVPQCLWFRNLYSAAAEPIFAWEVSIHKLRGAFTRSLDWKEWLRQPHGPAILIQITKQGSSNSFHVALNGAADIKVKRNRESQPKSYKSRLLFLANTTSIRLANKAAHKGSCWGVALSFYSDWLIFIRNVVSCIYWVA